MIDEDDARGAVSAMMSEGQASREPDKQVVVWKVEEHSRAWVLHVATRRWLRTREWRDELIGAMPYIVDKKTGQVHLYGSGPDGYAEFQTWLDGDEPRPTP